MKFAGFEFKAGRGELLYAGQRVMLQEQPLKLLALLLQTPGEVVSRERIRQELWGGTHTSHEQGIHTAVRKLRKALAAHGMGAAGAGAAGVSAHRADAAGSGAAGVGADAGAAGVGAGAGRVSIVTSAGRGYRLVLPAASSAPVQGNAAGREAYLSGRFLFSQRNPAALFAAREKFRETCQRLPRFALAHASLSRTCRFLTIFEVADPGPLWEEAERHARCAVELDPGCSEAQSALACVLARYRWCWAEGFAVYREALRLNPDDAETLCDYGVALLAVDAHDEGARCLERVLTLDPRYAIGRATVALGWIWQGRHKEAVGLLTEMTQAMPEFLTSWIYLAGEQLRTEQWTEAEASYRRALSLAPNNPTFQSLLALALAGQGQRAVAKRMHVELTASRASRYVSPTARALSALAAEDVSAALTAVEAVVEERDANFALYRRMRAFDSIRERREFVRTLETMNLAEGAASVA